MRTSTLVLVAYIMCVIVGAAWRLFTGTLHDAIPDVGALTAAYLGLTARRTVAPSVGGAVVLGYLVDVMSGGPAGLMALVLGLTTIIARTVQQRILVRGTMMTIAFSAFVALIAQVAGVLVRFANRMSHAGWATELKHIALVTLATAVVGPLVWRLFRRIDATFARTHRERDAALEGLVP